MKKIVLVTVEIVVTHDAHGLDEALRHLRNDGPHIDVSAVGYDEQDRSYYYGMRSTRVVSVRAKPKRRGAR